MKVLIIAEAGVNHNGNMDTARRLIEAAAEAGADYVKFQSFKAHKLVSKNAEKAEYQRRNMPDDSNDTQFTMLKKLELTHEQHIELIAHCHKKNIRFLSTAFDEESIQELYDLGIRLFKVPSGEITNLPFLQRVAKVADEVIISTGMCTMDDVSNAIEVFINDSFDKEKITLLHCTTEYPAPVHEVNLNAMCSMKSKFHVSVGYSDHTEGIEIPIAAVAMGASVIEKHFTLDKGMTGPDHKASLEPRELIAMVEGIRKIEVALGTGVKEPSSSELKNLTIARKSIHLSIDVFQGQTIDNDMLQMLRPGDGISPMELPKVIGRKALRNLAKGEKLQYSDLEV